MINKEVTNKPVSKNSFDHMVAFIDLLGFSDAVCNSPNNIENLYDFLDSFARYNRDYKKQHIGISQEGNDKYQVLSGFLSISDSIILSYPLNDLLPHNAIIRELEKIIGSLAYEAINNGFLIRGGIAQGALIHRNNIILGSALIRAHKLENSKDVAFGNTEGSPMVLIAKELVDLYKWNQPPSVTKEGNTTEMPESSLFMPESNSKGETIYHLRYMQAMLTNSFTSWHDIEEKYNKIKLIIENTLRKYELNENIRKKWQWFEKKLDEEFFYLQKFWKN